VGAVFVDLDVRVQRLFGRSIDALFADGEDRFRRYERLALRSLCDEPAFASRAVVVATGGGVVIDPANRDAMLAVGMVVHLDVPVPELAQRLLAAGERRARPLLTAAGPDGLPKRLAEILAKRRAAYLDRAVVIDGRGEADAVAARVLEVVSEPDDPVEADTQAS
jgi:shikimate kinase